MLFLTLSYNLVGEASTLAVLFFSETETETEIKGRTPQRRACPHVSHSEMPKQQLNENNSWPCTVSEGWSRDVPVFWTSDPKWIPGNTLGRRTTRAYCYTATKTKWRRWSHFLSLTVLAWDESPQASLQTRAVWRVVCLQQKLPRRYDAVITII